MKTRKSRTKCLFLQILTVVAINQDLKTTKIWTGWKTERFRYNLKEKIEISEISKFSILLYTQNRKLGNLGRLYFTSTFSSIWNPKPKNQKKNLRQKKYNFMMWFNKENVKISVVSGFSIWPYEQNWKLGNLEKFSFALNFDCFDCI